MTLPAGANASVCDGGDGISVRDRVALHISGPMERSCDLEQRRKELMMLPCEIHGVSNCCRY